MRATRTAKALATLGALAAFAVAGCASTHSTAAGHVHAIAATTPASPSAAQLAITSAVTAECADAQAIDTSMNAASTYGDFMTSVGAWESQLTAASHIPMTGVPHGPNAAREIQLDYAEANLALFVASEHDNPFGPHFSKGKVSRGYNTAAGKLQDVLNRCAAAGQPTKLRRPEGKREDRTMGVRVRLSRNASMYVPFWIAIPVWIIWASVMAVYGVLWVLFKVTAYGLSSAAAAIERKTGSGQS